MESGQDELLAFLEETDEQSISELAKAWQNNFIGPIQLKLDLEKDPKVRNRLKKNIAKALELIHILEKLKTDQHDLKQIASNITALFDKQLFAQSRKLTLLKNNCINFLDQKIKYKDTRINPFFTIPVCDDMRSLLKNPFSDILVFTRISCQQNLNMSCKNIKRNFREAASNNEVIVFQNRRYKPRDLDLSRFIGNMGFNDNGLLGKLKHLDEKEVNKVNIGNYLRILAKMVQE